jgi:hypothetical protein
MKLYIPFVLIAFVCSSFVGIFPKFLSPIMQDCKPSSPVSVFLTADILNENEVKNKISTEKIQYSNQDLSALKQQIDECNSNMETQLAAQKAKIDALTLKYQQILGAKDIEKLQEHLKQLEKSRQESLQTLEDNLAKCKRTGIFMGILREIDPYADINGFIQTTQNAIVPIAIEDIIGTNISRSTTVTDLQSVKDVITSYKGGKVQPALELYKKPLYAKKIFLYVLKNEVYPTKEIPKTNNSRLNLSSNTLVFNVLTEDYASEMQRIGISSEEIEQVRNKINTHKGVIETENENADIQAQNFANASMEEIRKIEREISDKKSELERKKQQLRSVLANISGVTFDEKNPATSVQNAQSLLKSQLQTLQREWFSIKEKEIAYRETSVQIDGLPQEAIAQKAKELFTQIQKNYTEFTVSSELITVEDANVTNYQAGTKVQKYRSVKQIWLYPSPQDDGTFKVGVVAMFGISDKKGGSGGAFSGLNTNQSSQTQTQTQTQAQTQTQTESSFYQMAKRSLSLQMPMSGGGYNGVAVAFDPYNKVYYATFAGNASYPLAKFNANGGLISYDEVGSDVRGLWYNVKKAKLEFNKYKGLNQPQDNSVGAYDLMNDKVYYWDGNYIYKYNNSTGALESKVSVLRNSRNVFSGYSLIYTGITGKEIGLLLPTEKKIFLFDKNTGGQKGEIKLPTTAVVDDQFNFSFANNLIWLFDINSRIWTGYSFQ